MGRRAKNGTLRVFPLTIPIFRRTVRVEVLCPLRQIVAIVGGGDEGAGLWIDPVSGIGGEASRKYRGAVLQRNSKNSGLALGGEFELVAQRISQQIVRRSAGSGPGDPDELGGVVFDGSHHLLLLRIPPFVGEDAMPVAVGTGEKRGVAGSGAGIGIVVIAVRKVGTVIEEKPEATLVELIAIAFEVIAAELINHDDDDQLGMSIVGRGEARHG